MASHFGTIGLEVEDREAYGELLRQLYEQGEADDAGGGATRVVWRGRGGARVALEIDAEGALTYVLPGLEPTGAPVPVRSVRLAPDGTAHLELLDGEDGEMLLPLPVELLDRVELRALPEPPARAGLRLSALAEELTVHADAAAYDASQSGRAPRFAPDHFIPIGLFRPDETDGLEEAEGGWQPTAHARFAGEVVAVERVVSEISGEEFFRLRVRTIAGIEVDVAAAAGQLPAGAPESGRWVVGTFFMTGSLGLGPTG